MREIRGRELLNIETLRAKTGWHRITEKADQKDNSREFHFLSDVPGSPQLYIAADWECEFIQYTEFGGTHWHHEGRSPEWRNIWHAVKAVRGIVSGRQKYLMIYAGGGYVCAFPYDEETWHTVCAGETWIRTKVHVSDGHCPDRLYIRASLKPAESGAGDCLTDAEGRCWQRPEFRRVVFNQPCETVQPDWSRYRPVPLGWILEELWTEEEEAVQRELMAQQKKYLSTQGEEL